MPVSLRRLSWPLAGWLALVAGVYTLAVIATAAANPGRVDPAMTIAMNLLRTGSPSIGFSPGTSDTVTRNGATYHVISLGPVLAYLPFVPFETLHIASGWVTSLAFGILAATLAWPLAGAYGLSGPRRRWFAALVAFGTLLFPLSVRGDMYYLAQAEAMAATFVALIEWQGRRRAPVVGAAFALAALARPTVLIATVPLGAWLVWKARSRARAAVGLAAPLAAGLVAMGAWNAARFGSPLESGYAIAQLDEPTLAALRSQGTFSLRHVGPNLATLLAAGFGVRDAFPWLVPSNWGHSILLTTPALVVGIGAPWRNRTVRVMSLAALLVTAVLLTYYGGAGWQTYGYRYFLDATPFLLVLVAMAMRARFGRPERLLIVLSVAFCTYGVVAGVMRLGA